MAMASLPPCDMSEDKWPPGAVDMCEVQTTLRIHTYSQFSPSKLVQLCAIDACMAVIGAIRAANPTECLVSRTGGTGLYDKFLSRVDAACQSVAAPSPTPSTNDNSNTPPPTPKAKTTKPTVTKVIGAIDSSNSRGDGADVASSRNESMGSQADGHSSANATKTPAPSLDKPIVLADGSSSTARADPTGSSTPFHQNLSVIQPHRRTPSSDGATTTSASASSSSSHVAWIVAALAVGFFVVALAIVWFRRRRRRVQRTDDKDLKTPSTGDTTASSAFTSLHEPHATNELAGLLLPLSDWRVDATAITDVSLLGGGAQGAVYLVKLHDAQLLVAKRLAANQCTPSRLQAMVHEIQVVSSLQHPSIVRFVGVAWTSGYDLQALFEYMAGGDLRSFLDTTERTPWTLEKVQIALHVAEGLAFVHSFNPPLVHRDLKARNVLLNESLNAKVSDFGVSRSQSENGTMTTGIGTSRWLAPEVIRGGGIYTERCDIYSFGVLLVEMDTHAAPFAELDGTVSEILMLRQVADGELRPQLTDACDPSIAEIVSQCLLLNPSKRPNALELAFAIRQVVKTFKNSS